MSLHIDLMGGAYPIKNWRRERPGNEARQTSSLEPRLSVPNFVSPIFLQSCETKSGTESLGSRLANKSRAQPARASGNVFLIGAHRPLAQESRREIMSTLRVLVGCKRVIDYAVKVCSHQYSFLHRMTRIWCPVHCTPALLAPCRNCSS